MSKDMKAKMTPDMMESILANKQEAPNEKGNQAPPSDMMMAKADSGNTPNVPENPFDKQSPAFNIMQQMLDMLKGSTDSTMNQVIVDQSMQGLKALAIGGKIPQNEIDQAKESLKEFINRYKIPAVTLK